MSSIKIDQRKEHQYRGVAAPVISKLLIYSFVLLALGLAIYGVLYPFINFQDPFHLRYDVLPKSMLYSHIVGAGVAIGIIPLQYYIASRKRTLHRYLGYLYVLAVLVSSFGAYYMAVYALGDVSSTNALSILAALWWSSCFYRLSYI